MAELQDDPKLMRLSKLMVARKICSRREADYLIAKGWVMVDGKIINQLGYRVVETVDIKLTKEARRTLAQAVTIILNKPVGYVSSQPEKDYKCALSLIAAENQDLSVNKQVFSRNHLLGLAPAGRLDIDSSGLLVFTQDGSIARQLIGKDSMIEKEYLVRVSGTLSAADLKLLQHGLALDGKKLKPAKVEWLNQDQLRFVLIEGKKRQIRRMCELVGLQVTGLKRVRIGKVRLGRLQEGMWRYLNPDEEF